VEILTLQALTDWHDRLQPLMDLGWQAAIAPPANLNGLTLAGRSPAIIEQTLPLLEWITHTYFQTQTDG